jgi:hypothetical protein
MTLDEIMSLAPVIPVLIIEDVAHAVPLGRALVAGGLPSPPSASNAWSARSKARWWARARC